MRTTVGFLSALFFFLPAATAQEMVAWERFFPGEAGDRWTFREVYEWCYGYEEPYCEVTTVVHTYEVAERVETDTSVVMEIQSAQSLCQISIAENEEWFTVEQVQGDRCLPLKGPPGNLNFPQDEPASPATVNVNGFDYTVAALKPSGGGSFGGHKFAADLGMYEYFSQIWFEEQQFSAYFRLTGAEVEGVVYGFPVSTEPGGPPNAGDFTLYPNPFSDGLKLQVETPTGQPVVVEVFDMLGRRVLRKEGVPSGLSVLDLAHLVRGTYVIRLIGPGGDGMSRRVLKMR